MRIYLNKSTSLAKLYSLIAMQLEEGGSISFTVKGTSMTPMLKSGIDNVQITKPAFPLKKYDIVFYRRKNGQFVMHRIIKVKKDGYVCRGDNQTVKEYPLTENMIIGILSEYTHKGKQKNADAFTQKIYALVYVHTAYLRYYIKLIFRR